ncbi:phosphoglycolate phosphatase [Ottowia flava]|uniref:Phosphoglycolate phosphatase n=1 Tax=Ottowia flava TaxID=2675430 RepID=A0ABW4KYY9_9BURK
MVDLDGTLVDTLGDFEAALAAMLTAIGRHPLSRAQIERLVGKGSEHLIRSVLALTAPAGAQQDPAAQEALTEQAWRYYQAEYLRINGQCSTAYSGAEAGLKALRAQGLRLACLTNKPIAFARPLLAAKGLEGYFDHVFGGDSFARKKPDPLPLIETCRALRSAPAQTLMVGDSSNDAAAARAAGCPVVLVTYGYNHGEPIRAVDADGFVDRLDALALRAATATPTQ